MTSEKDDQLWDAYLEGFAEGKNVEELSEISKQTARTQFKKWKRINDV